jgi:F0F1-type ATP synthase assembly protein I
MTGAPKDSRPGAPYEKRAPKGGLSGVDFAAIPFQLAISILAGVYAGQWLDKKLGSAPWLLILGLFLGAGLSFYSIYVKLMAAQAHDEALQKLRRDERP